MEKIYIMSGLPFSGKSTLSKAISSQMGIPRISFDETWMEIEKESGSVPGNDGVEKWRYICKVCEEKAQRLLKNGSSVVYDNLGSSKNHRDEIKKLAEEVGADSVVVFVDVSKEEVIKRREQNLSTKERAQVSDENFDTALLQFERPTDEERVIVFKLNESIEEWINREI